MHPTFLANFFFSPMEVCNSRHKRGIKYPNRKSEYHSNDFRVTFSYYLELGDCNHLAVISPLNDIWTLFSFEWKHLIKKLKTQIFELASLEKYIMAYFFKLCCRMNLKDEIFNFITSSLSHKLLNKPYMILLPCFY